MKLNDLFVGGEGAIFHFNDVSWSESFTDAITAFTGIWGDDSGNVFATGRNYMGGKLLHYHEGVWAELEDRTFSGLNCIWSDADGNSYAAGYSGAVYRISPLE